MSRNESRIDFFQPQVMAIGNVTDDSFYEGSRTQSDDAIVERVREVVEQGATIVDVGGYSSRPGAKDISAEEEWQRVQRGLQAVRSVSKGVAVSVDTFRSEVARRSIEQAGAIIVNDISAGEADAAMVDVVAHYGVPYVAMHMRGTPQTMQQHIGYERGVVADVADYFRRRTEWLRERGVKDIILDPGFGFAKEREQEYQLLAALEELTALGYPLLVGISRKSMIYRLLGVTPDEALNGTTALNTVALMKGAHILRVHDVKACRQCIDVVDKLRNNL